MTSAAALSPPPVPAVPEPPRRRVSRAWRALGWALLGLVLLAAAGALTYWRWSRSALPQVDGEVRLPSLSAPVTVRRDALGVPHLQAASVPDLMRAQGYVTAQDRMWQMDLLRRRARGELAEAFGPAALTADREIRTLGLGDAARRSLPRLPPDLRLLVDAYTEGVNAWLDAHEDALPLEFRLLRYAPRRWEAVDSIAVGKLLALDLAQGWDDEALRARAYDRLPVDVQEMLFPKVFAQDRILIGSDSAPARGAGPAAETAVGSNNWVISGAHTATGRPLLANDPHLGLAVPSIWTAVHLTAPDMDVAGVVLPGSPGVILGRNRRIAWGCTNVHDDSADLYVEEFDPQSPDRYRTADGWATVETRKEPIRVREGSLSSSWRTVDHVVRLTRRGPLVTIGARQYALRWTALADDAVELTSFARLQRAGSWDEFRAALSLFPGPAQNFVYADVDGHIGWYSAGRLPLRRAGDGSRPYAGASPDGDWLGFAPFDALPHLFDPPSGRIVTANNRLVGSDYPYKVTRGGVGPWRAAAIFERLEAREGWTTDDVAALQGERLSIPHRDLARALVEAAARHGSDAEWQAVAREMSGWDGRLEAESRPAALAVITFRAIGTRVILPRVQRLPMGRALARRTAAIHRLLLERPASWVPARDGDWDGVLLGAWRAAESEIGQRLGTDRSRWTWGALNVMAVPHPLARALAVFGPLLSPPAAPMGGFSTTPNVLSISPSGTVDGPSMRFVANLADPDDTRLVNFLGQSGHAASPHYEDQLGPWRRVETRRLPFTAEAVAREARHTLRLVP